ncbi:MAG: hypothetical protein PVH61_39075 [Candidatus Aminicenantes bacterium]
MTKKTILIAVIIVLTVTSSFTQVQPQRRYWNRANRLHTFDVSTPIQISGVIVKVENCNTGMGWYANGINLTVENGKQQSLVRLGPVAYLGAANRVFKQGDKVIVKAFEGTGNYAGEFFAAEVTRDGKNLLLRDQYGFPMWRQSLRGGRGMGRGWGRGWGRGRGWGQGWGRGRGRGGYGARY